MEEEVKKKPDKWEEKGDTHYIFSDNGEVKIQNLL